MPKFDLSNTITNDNNEPLFTKVSYHTFEEPEQVTVKSTGKVIKNAFGFLTEGKKLTYRKAIQNALLADIDANHPDYQKMPDKEDRMLLAMKLIADKEVELSAENDIPVILKASKVALPMIQYMRIYQLFEE